MSHSTEESRMSKVRRRGMATCLALSLLCLGAHVSWSASASPAGRNLLVNPGFEAGRRDHPWMPAGWDTFPSSLPTVFFGRDTTLVHGGRYAVSVANLSTQLPMFHNWSQTLVVGPETWNKDLVFTVWTKSNGLQGRAYVLLQAYRDTITKMSKVWKLSRDEAQQRLGIGKLDDPLLNLGWKRQYFNDPETDWVKREVRIFVPPSSDVVIVRCGIFGTGQVLFDDASLVVAAPQPAAPLPLNTNLLADPSFEGDGNAWEYSMPPYEGLVVERDSTVAHGGKASLHMEGGLEGVVSVRTGVCQIFMDRDLSKKRLRLSGWVKTDSLKTEAWIMGYSTTLDGDVRGGAPPIIDDTHDWTPVSLEFDTPPGTYMVAAWFLYSAPGTGRLWYDDCSLEVLGPAKYLSTGEAPPKAATLPSR
jgi:hypothetical protein